MKRRFKTSLASGRSRAIGKQTRSLQVERMESRLLMTADLGANLEVGRLIDPTWFQRLEPAMVGEAAEQSLPTQTISWHGRDAEVVVDEWIVQFDSGSGVTTASDAADFFATRDRPVTIVGGLGSPGQVLVQTPGVATGEIIGWWDSLPELEFFEPNLVVEPQRTPNDPLFSSLWGLRNSLDQDIDADRAWDLSTGSSNVVVGVIDTGVDYRHVDLAKNIWTNPREVPGDRIDNDGNGFVDDVHGFDFYHWDGDPLDGHGHGTHVAGTIAAAGNNGQGVTGVNWDASIMAIQIFNQFGQATSTSNIVAAINYATMMKVDYGVNVRVTNNSWGGGGYSQAMRDSIARSGDAEILFVAAAGNFANNNDASAFYPASYDATNIISVAAVDSSGRYASFSNYGARSVDVAAPGVDVLSTLPGNRYGYLSGTSMAAPHVAGVVALAAAANPAVGHMTLKQAVLDTVDRLSDTSRATLTNGRVNAYSTLVRVEPMPGDADRFGIWRPEGGQFFLDSGAVGYNGERPFQLGLPGDRPIAGDWDGDGEDEVGVFRPNGGWFYLDAGKPGYDGERPFQFGLPGDLPIAGDWNGDGKDEVGIFRPSSGSFYLDTGSPGYNGEKPIQFGLPGDLPIAGDWNGDGRDEVGVFRPSSGSFYLDTGSPGYNGEKPIQFGLPGDLPIAGDWNGDGKDTVGVFRPNGGLVYLDTGAAGYNGERPFQFGLAGDFPIAGSWAPSVAIASADLARGGGTSGMRLAISPDPVVFVEPPLSLDGLPVQTTADSGSAAAQVRFTTPLAQKLTPIHRTRDQVFAGLVSSQRAAPPTLPRIALPGRYQQPDSQNGNDAALLSLLGEENLLHLWRDRA